MVPVRQLHHGICRRHSQLSTKERLVGIALAVAFAITAAVILWELFTNPRASFPSWVFFLVVAAIFEAIVLIWKVAINRIWISEDYP